MTLRTFGWNEFGFLLTALQWTVLLTIIALVGGGIVGFSSLWPVPRTTSCCASPPAPISRSFRAFRC